jgi:hypothetical protein
VEWLQVMLVVLVQQEDFQLQHLTVETKQYSDMVELQVVVEISH